MEEQQHILSDQAATPDQFQENMAASITLTNSLSAELIASMQQDFEPGIQQSVVLASIPDAGDVSEQNGASADPRHVSFGAKIKEEAMAEVEKLRSHLWTFEHSAVAHLHASLDKLENLFK